MDKECIICINNKVLFKLFLKRQSFRDAAQVLEHMSNMHELWVWSLALATTLSTYGCSSGSPCTLGPSATSPGQYSWVALSSQAKHADYDPALFCRSLKNDEISFATVWIDTEDIMLKQINQMDKPTHCIISFICGVQKKQTHKNFWVWRPISAYQKWRGKWGGERPVVVNLDKRNDRVGFWWWT